MTARRLAAILDVVGYSRLVSADEADERLTARRCPHVWYWHQNPRYRRRVQWQFAAPLQHIETWSSAMILSPNTLSELTLDLHQAQIAPQWDRLEVPNGGGQNEAFDRIIDAADSRVRDCKQ